MYEKNNNIDYIIWIGEDITFKCQVVILGLIEQKQSKIGIDFPTRTEWTYFCHGQVHG